MTYPDSKTLVQSFQVTYHIIKLQTTGLSHKDSVIQPPFRSNCLNWVLGHILVGRNQVLDLLNEGPVRGHEEMARYETDSDPIVSNEQALPLGELLKDLEQSQERIVAALEQISPEALGQPIVFRGSERPLGQAIVGQHWHETYHTGQLELLRQLAGTNDAII